MSFIQKSLDFFKNKLVKNGIGKKVLASTLVASFLLGSAPLDAFALTLPLSMRSGDVELILAAKEGPAIRHMLPGVSAGAKLNYGATSNTFRIITGTAQEANPANRPQPPVNPNTAPDWGTKTPEEQAAAMEAYNLAVVNHEAAMKAYWRNPDTWKKPKMELSASNNIVGSVSDFTAANGGLSSYVFDPATVTDSSVVKSAHDITITGKAKGNDKLDVVLTYETIGRETLDVNDVTSLIEKEDRATYVMKVTNTDEEQAQVFGTSWNVDTWVVGNDNAPFRGPGFNLFGTGSIAVGFPSKIADNLTGNAWTTNANARNLFPNNVNPYVNSVPDYAYAQDGSGPNATVAIIYPQTDKSRKYPDVSRDQSASKHFELPSYFGIGYYGQIASTGVGEDGTNFYWHALTGIGSGENSSNDSGHIVRYDPRLIMPGETKYFGVTYGLASVDQKNPNGPFIMANNPKLKTSLNTNNEYEDVTLDLLYGNTSSTSYNNAKIKMYLPVNYLLANSTMEQGSAGVTTVWTKEPTQVTKLINGREVLTNVWTTDIGTLAGNNSDGISVSNRVIIKGIPQTASRNDGTVLAPKNGNPKTGVIPVYAFELEYNGVAPNKTATTPAPSGAQLKDEYKYTHKDLPVEMPFAAPVNLFGDIWRDVNGDSVLQPNEGIAGVTAEITPSKDPATPDKVVSIYKGVFPFENGYARNRAVAHNLKFTPRDLAAMEKYIWEFDEYFTVSGGVRIDPNVPVFVKYANPNAPAGGVFEKFEILTDELGNAKVDFKVKADSADSAYVHFRMKELLAGKLNVYPYVDQNNNGQYDAGTDKLIKTGEYRLGRLQNGQIGAPYYTKGLQSGQASSDLAKLTDPEHTTHKVVAFRDYAVDYRPAFGFRYAVDGKNSAFVVRRNADSVLKSPSGSPIPIELMAKDVKFASANANTDYPSMNLESTATLVADPLNPTKQIVEVPMASTSAAVEKELVFNAWKDLGADDKVAMIADLASKRATDFKWEVVSDAKGILDAAYNGNTISNDGKVKIKPNVFGVARIKVSFADDDRIYDEMLIKVSNPIEQPGEQVVALVIDNVTVDTGQKSQLINLKAKIQKADGTFRFEDIDPTQVDEFKPNPEGKFVIELAQNPDKRFTVKGIEAGTHEYTAKYNGAPIPVEGTVTVNAGQITSQNYKLEIQPTPITMKAGTGKDFKVMLVPLAGGASRDITNEVASTTAVGNTNIATIPVGTPGHIDGLVVGETVIQVSYGTLTANGQVKVYDDSSVISSADGNIGFEEVTSPLTNGIIPENGQADYKLFRDLNGDGKKDAGEPYIRVTDLDSYAITGGGATVADVPGQPNTLRVTGVTAGTTPKLVAIATIDNQLYAGEKPITVIGNGETIASIKLDPTPIIIKAGSTTDIGRLIATTSGSNSTALQRSQYELLLSNTHAAEIGDKIGLPIRLKGNSIGVTDMTAKLAGVTDATGKVVVIPADTKIEIDPTWVKQGDSKTVPVRITGTGMTPDIEAILKPLVVISTVNTGVGTPDPSDPTKVTGVDVGTTKIKAEIPQVPGLKGSGDLYVYEDGQIIIDPDPVNVTVGQEARTNIFLTDSNDPSKKIPVPATQATVTVEDPQYATVPGPVTTNHIPVEGVKVGGTKLKVTIPATGTALDKEADINVSAGARGLVVTPNNVTLYEGNTTGIEIVTKDRTTGDIIPVSQLVFTDFSEANKNKVEIRDNKAYLLKDQPSNGIVGDNILTVKTTGGAVAGVVKILNSNVSSGNAETYKLVAPDFVLALSNSTPEYEKGVVDVNNLMVEKYDASGNLVSTVPISTFNPNKADIVLQANTPIQSGSIASAASAPATDLFDLTPTTAGAASYKVTYRMTTPSGVINLEATGKVAIFAQDPTTLNPGDIEIIVTTPVDQGNGNTQDVEIDYNSVVPAAKTQHAKIKITYPDGTEQIVGGEALPNFVHGDLTSDDNQFEVAPNGELRGKVPTGNLTTVKGKIRTTTDPNTSMDAGSKRFRFDQTGPIGPANPNEQLIVTPKKMVLLVGESDTVTAKIKNTQTSVETPITDPAMQAMTGGIVTIGSNGRITGDTPGTTKVRITHNGRIEEIEVVVVDPTTAKITIEQDDSRTTPNVDPNDPSYPGGFIVPGEVVKVPVGGKVPFVVKINGVEIPYDRYSFAGTNHSSIVPADREVEGVTPGVDEVTVSLIADPNIKKEFKVIVYDAPNPANPQPTIQILDKPNVFRAASEATRQINAAINLNGAAQATVIWIVANTDVADIGGAAQVTDGPNANTNRDVTINWIGPERPVSTKLTAIILENGAQDETTLLGKQLTAADVQGFTGFGDPITLVKDLPTSIDTAASTLDIKLIDTDANEFPQTIADFDVVSVSGPLQMSGLGNRTLMATDVGPKFVNLKHRVTGTPVVLEVKIAEDNIPTATVTFNPGTGTLVGTATHQIQVGQTIPTANIPTVTPPAGYNFTGWTPDPTQPITGNITFTAQFTATGGGGGGSSSGGGGTTPRPNQPTTPAKNAADTKVELPTALNSKDHIKYVLGYPDGTVRPNKAITRAEVATIFYRLLTAEARDKVFVPTNNFSDVKAANWYNKAVSSMSNGKYIQGYPNGTFGGNRNITRAEFVAIAARFMSAKSATVNFSDVKSNHWAKDYIATAVAYGWINGYENGTFRPDQEITRAEAMAIVNRMLNRGVDAKGLEKVNYKDFSDNVKSAWYYYEVIEATNDHEYTGSRPSEVWTKLEVTGYSYDVVKYERP